MTHDEAPVRARSPLERELDGFDRAWTRGRDGGLARLNAEAEAA